MVPPPSSLRESWATAKQHWKLLSTISALSLALAFVVAWILQQKSWTAGIFATGQTGGSVADVDAVTGSPSSNQVPLLGILEEIHGREVVWQIPEAPFADKPKGVAFFAHGCTHRAAHFWPRSESCATCTGLPEDARNVQVALSRGFAVIAISSEGVCWDASMPPEKSKDIPDVALVLRHWQAKHGLDQLPLVAMGASSGGYLISSLAHAVKIDSLTIMIASGVEEAFTERPDFGLPYPPTLFIHMPRDFDTGERVQRSLEVLRSQGVKIGEIRCGEMRIGPSFLSSRIEGFDFKISRNIYDALVESGLVNGTGYLLPPYRINWKPAIQGKGIILESNVEERVQEELKLAFGWHEMTSEYAEEMVDWFEGICVMRNQAGERGDASSGRCKLLDMRG